MIVYQGAPATSSAVLFAADRRVISYTVVAANLTGATATFRINHCVAAAAAANANVVIPDLELHAHEVIALDFPLELAQGDMLRGVQNTTNAITVTIDATDGTQT